MFAMSILPVGLVLGAIAWGAVGALRSRGREEFTLATAANFYAQVLFVAGVVVTLAGLALLIKVGLSNINASYSYYMPPAPPVDAPYKGAYYGPNIGQQEAQDLILASVLIVAGVLVAVGHWFLSRFVGTFPGASPSWVVQGTPVALTVLCGLVGIFSAIFAVFQTLTYFIVGNRQGGTAFGDPVGTATVFVIAWVIAMSVLLRQVRKRSGKTPPGQAAAPA